MRKIKGSNLALASKLGLGVRATLMSKTAINCLYNATIIYQFFFNGANVTQEHINRLSFFKSKYQLYFKKGVKTTGYLSVKPRSIKIRIQRRPSHLTQHAEHHLFER